VGAEWLWELLGSQFRFTLLKDDCRTKADLEETYELSTILI